MTPKNKKHVLLVLKSLIATGVISLLIGSGQIDFETVGRSFSASPAWVILAAGCILLGICSAALRWQILLEAQDLSISYWNTLRLTFVGIFFGTFMPGGTGGDIAKVYYVWRTGSKRTAAVTAVVLDRAIGLYSMLALATIMALLQAGTLWPTNAKLLIICVPSVFLLVTFGTFLAISPPFHRLIVTWRDIVPNRIVDIVNEIYEALSIYRRNKTAIAWALVLSLVSHVALSFVFCISAYVLGDLAFDIHTYLFIAPLGLIANAIPLLPMGIGQGEVAFHFLYKALANSTYGAESCIFFRCLVMFWASAGGLAYITLKGSVISNKSTDP